MRLAGPGRGQCSVHFLFGPPVGLGLEPLDLVIKQLSVMKLSRNEAVYSSVKHPGALNIVRCAVDIEQTFIVPLQLLFRKGSQLFFLTKTKKEQREITVCVYKYVWGECVYVEREDVGKVSNFMH